jgi:two-component system, sensor histidine kinase YesM
MKIRTQLLILYFVAGTIPLLLLSAYLVNNTSRLVLQERFTQASADNRRVKVIVFSVTYLATNVSETIYYDEHLRQLVGRRYADDAQAYAAYRGYTLMDAYLANYTEISGITVYTNNPTMPVNARFRRITAEVAGSAWFRTAEQSGGEVRWVVDAEPDQPVGLRLLRKIPIAGGAGFAVLVITVSNNYLKLMIDDAGLRTFAALDGEAVFFSDDSADIGGRLPIAVDDSPVPRTGTARRGGAEVLYAASSQSAVKAVDAFRILTIDENALGDVRRVTAGMALLVTASLAVPYVVILLFLGMFGRRVGTLRREMHKVASGDFRVVDSLEGRDELSDAFSDMTVMVDRIQQLTREVDNEKFSKEMIAARQQRMELKMLASQINPHFLFNTLETIRMKAFVNGDAEVAHLTKLLGKSIRRALEIGQAPVSLASEIASVGTYMEIQSARFRDKINYGINVADDVDPEHYCILPLLLQPLVENSIGHGLESKEGPGWVRIDVRRREEMLVISVADNGVGMTEERCASLREALQAPDGTQAHVGIGLANVHQRIRLFYGSGFGIELESRPGGGAVVRLLLPGDGKGVNGKRGDDHEGPDRG